MTGRIIGLKLDRIGFGNADLSVSQCLACFDRIDPGKFQHDASALKPVLFNFQFAAARVRHNRCDRFQTLEAFGKVRQYLRDDLTTKPSWLNDPGYGDEIHMERRHLAGKAWPARCRRSINPRPNQAETVAHAFARRQKEYCESP